MALLQHYRYFHCHSFTGTLYSLRLASFLITHVSERIDNAASYAQMPGLLMLLPESTTEKFPGLGLAQSWWPFMSLGNTAREEFQNEE